jgi:hypothetical protein
LGQPNTAVQGPSPPIQNSTRKQSSWYFIAPLEKPEVRRQVMIWAGQIKGDIGEEVRERVSLEVKGERG